MSHGRAVGRRQAGGRTWQRGPPHRPTAFLLPSPRQEERDPLPPRPAFTARLLFHEPSAECSGTPSLFLFFAAAAVPPILPGPGDRETRGEPCWTCTCTVTTLTQETIASSRVAVKGGTERVPGRDSGLAWVLLPGYPYIPFLARRPTSLGGTATGSTCGTWTVLALSCLPARPRHLFAQGGSWLWPRCDHHVELLQGTVSQPTSPPHHASHQIYEARRGKARLRPAALAVKTATVRCHACLLLDT